MAARTKHVTLDASWREKISTSMLVNRLMDHVKGVVEMSATQLRAAEILLRKTLPDLSAIEQTTDVNIHYVARVPNPQPEMSEWQRLHADALKNQTKLLQ